LGNERYGKFKELLKLSKWLEYRGRFFWYIFVCLWCTQRVRPCQTDCLRRLTTSRRRAHQVDDHQQGPKAAYAPGDATPLARPISDRLGYPRPMKCPEVWPRWRCECSWRCECRWTCMSSCCPCLLVQGPRPPLFINFSSFPRRVY
jgi:hypothetical protein